MEYNLSFAELIDRMTILELKMVHAPSEEVKNSFFEEMKLVRNDISAHGFSHEIIRFACLLAIVNVTIWDNEDDMRKETEDAELTLEQKAKIADRLIKTHKLNATRSFAKSMLQNFTNGRLDEKLNYISGLWNIKY